jgi:hypothetical protein
MDTINTELASFKSAHAPIDSTECVVRILSPDLLKLKAISDILFDMFELSGDLIKHHDYADEDNRDTDTTQERFETPNAGFSLLYAKLKWLVEGK